MDYYDPAFPNSIKLDGYVASAAPFSSHAVAIDTLVMTIQQVNK